MQVTEVKSISKYLFGARFIGMGTTALCFLLRDGRVLKLYLDTYNRYSLFRNRNMMEHLTYLSGITNDSYIGPEEVLTKNGEIIAYIMPYSNGKSMNKIEKYTRLRTILSDYDKLMIDTKSVSDASYRIYDLHERNILYSSTSGFNVIDLDGGQKDSYYKVERVRMFNKNDLTKIIIKSFFGLKSDYDIEFRNYELNNFYKDMAVNDENTLDKLVSSLEEEVKLKNPTIGDIKKRKKELITVIKPKDYYGW